MNGGGPANTLVRSLDSGWGRALFSNILIRNVAQSLYKVRPYFTLYTMGSTGLVLSRWPLADAEEDQQMTGFNRCPA